MRFADKVRALMKEKHLTQEELAGMLGTYQTQVSRWVDSDTPPKAAYLLPMARALGVTVDYLIDPDQKPGGRDDSLTEDDRAILDLYHALGISRLEAMRRLVGGAVMPAEAAEPATGDDAPAEYSGSLDDPIYVDALPGNSVRIVALEPGDVVRQGSLYFVAIPKVEGVTPDPAGEIRNSLYDARSGAYIDGKFWHVSVGPAVVSRLLLAVADQRPIDAAEFSSILKPLSKDILVTHPISPELRLPGDMDYLVGPRNPFRAKKADTVGEAVAQNRTGEPIQHAKIARSSKKSKGRRGA